MRILFSTLLSLAILYAGTACGQVEPERSGSPGAGTRMESMPDDEPLLGADAPQAEESAGLPRGVAARFQEFWQGFSSSQLKGNSLRPRLNELVAGGSPSVKHEACSAYAKHVAERVQPGDPELLLGVPDQVAKLEGRCWTIHYDGMMGPGLSAAMNEERDVILVWIIAEG